MLFAKYFNKSPVSLAISLALLVPSGGVLAYESPVHIFSVDDVLGDFEGNTFADDPSIICGIGSVSCPSDNPPITDKSGVTLYPVDSEFGYYVVDFLGAQQKTQDGDYKEGFVGNISEAGEVIGIQVANAPTEKYKVKPPLGTWCQGLGGTSVKCETEHYTVMEHVLSCHETIPYLFADPASGTQASLSIPDTTLEFDCDAEAAHLDDNALILVDGVPGIDRLTNAEPCEADGDPEGCQMFPNDKTNMLKNIALSSDYSVQLKDDGKPLYGWGGMHKRPNDIRLYAKLDLPLEWKAPDADFVVTRAELVINHWITNNPNDQLRPEDLENEAATGRKPSYRIEGDVWKSTVACYEGDGDIIDTEEGANDPTFIGVGTVLKNTPMALDRYPEPEDEPGVEPGDDPYAFSSDLYGGYTNGYYTTINRDPFEWSYDRNEDPNVQDFIGSPFPDDSLGELVSGPRWRLKANKFGQDLPGLEIPLIECSAPPFAKDNIKYQVGTPTTTVINLLDWNDEETSPLATSKGWVDVTENEFVTIVSEPGEAPVSSNGLPMSEDFDLAVYIKGDSKSTAVYNAQLIIEYDGETIEEDVDTTVDVALTAFTASEKVTSGDTVEMDVEVSNLKSASVNGEVTVSGVTSRGDTIELESQTFSDLAETATILTFSWPAETTKVDTVTWTATVSVEDDLNTGNNTGSARTKIRKAK